MAESNLILFNPSTRCGTDNATLTMSSREIAELTGKRHGDVIRDIQKMLTDLEKDDANLRHDDSKGIRVERDNRNYISEIHLPRCECEILMLGYSMVLRARVIDRWHELEAQVNQTAIQLPDFTQPAVAARDWADQYERATVATQEVEKLTAENAAMVLIVVAFRRLCDAGGHPGHD